MKDYKKYFIIETTPEDVFLALTNPLTIQLWTGEPAIMSKNIGDEFSLWSGSIVGKNIEIVENKKIVQQWYFGDLEESIVTIKLHQHNNGTSLELIHTNIPDDDYENIVSGWENDYMGSIQEFYSE